MDCSRQMLKFEDDWIIECFCKELTKVNITPQYDNIPLSQQHVAAAAASVPSTSVRLLSTTAGHVSTSVGLVPTTAGPQSTSAGHVSTSVGLVPTTAGPQSTSAGPQSTTVDHVSTFAGVSTSAGPVCLIKLAIGDTNCAICGLTINNNCVVAVMNKNDKVQNLDISCAAKIEKVQMMLYSKKVTESNRKMINDYLRKESLSCQLQPLNETDDKN